MKKKLVILTGAGISAESGIATFRDSNGLWSNYRVEDVATPEGYFKNKALVLDFYNKRRAELENVEPNKAHLVLAELESDFDVTIITQNIDDLHERAGSTHIIHLHGELTKISDENKNNIKNIGYNKISIGDKVGETQARPWIVWFGEAVPEMENAIREVEEADYFVVIGTSLNVYPAASLINYTKKNCNVFIIDINNLNISQNITFINKKATEGINDLKDMLLGK